MGWTKKQLITQAFEELGLSASIYDLTSAQLETAANKLNAMMAAWSTNGVRVGWASPSTQALNDINQDSLAPDFANEAIYTNLAVRLSSSFGKIVSPELKSLAVSSYSDLVNALTGTPPEYQLPRSLPMGAGYKRQYYKYTPQRQSPLLADDGQELTFE